MDYQGAQNCHPQTPGISAHHDSNSLHLASFIVKKESAAYGEWFDLDRLLVRFLESCPARQKIIWMTLSGGKQGITGFIEYLLPELKRRGMIDLDE